MKKVLYAFILMICLVGGLGVGLVYRKHLADEQAGGGDPGPLVAANDNGAANGAATAPPNNALGIPGAIATTTAPDSSAGDVGAALAAGGQTPSTMAAATQPELSTSDVTGRSAGEPMGASDFTPSSSGGSSSASSSSSSSGSGRHHHGSSSSASSGGTTTTTTFVSSEPAVPKSQVIDDSTSKSFGTEVGGDTSEPKSTKSGKHGKTAKATPAPTAVASSGGTDAEMPTIDDNTGGGSTGGGSSGGGDPFGTMDSSTPAPTPEPTKVAMIPKGGGELDFPAGAGGSYLKKVTQRQNGDKSIIHVDLAGSASYRVIALRNPSRVFIDFEETSVPGGNSQPVAGTVSHVKEIIAKQFTSAGGISIARVQITLTDDKVPGASKGTADGGLDVVLGEKQDSF